MVVFLNSNIEWRVKPEPIVYYINTYDSKTPNIVRGVHCYRGVQCYDYDLDELHEAASGDTGRTGYFKLIFEEGKDPHAEWVKQP